MPSQAYAANFDRAERLLALLSQQKSLVDQLAALADRQGSAVRDENAETLLELLGRRQELIDRIAMEQREIASFNESVAALAGDRESMCPKMRMRIAGLIGEIERGLADVMRRDDEAREEIVAIQKRARAEIKTFGNTQQARRAYVPQSNVARQGASSPRFSDEKG